MSVWSFSARQIEFHKSNQFSLFLSLPFLPLIKTNYPIIKNRTDRLSVCCFSLWTVQTSASLSVLSDLCVESVSEVPPLTAVSARLWCVQCLGVLYKAADCMVDIMHRDTLNSVLSQSRSEKWLCQFEWALYVCSQGTGTQCSGVTGERGKQRKKETEEGFYHSVTKSAPTVRQSAGGWEGEGVRGRGLLAQWQGAQWWHSSLSVGTNTHNDNTLTYTHTHQGIPPLGVRKWSNTTHHCLITPVPTDRRAECREVFPRTTAPRHYALYITHAEILFIYMMS